MKKSIYFRFIMDIAMGIVFALFFNHKILGGLTYHETAGLVIGVAVVVHLIFNRKWIKHVSKALFDKKIPSRTKVGWIVDLLLLIDMFLIILSGIAISKVLFPSLNIQGSILNQNTHVACAYLGLALLGIHIGLHWTWTMNMFKKVFHIRRSSVVLAWFARFLAVLVMLFGLYHMVSTNYFGQISRIMNSSSGGKTYHNSSWDGTSASGASDASESSDASSSETRENDNYFSENHSEEDSSNSAPTNSQDDSMKTSYQGSSTNAFIVAVKYLSIMGLFAGLEYYLEKLLCLKRKKA